MILRCDRPNRLERLADTMPAGDRRERAELQAQEQVARVLAVGVVIDRESAVAPQSIFPVFVAGRVKCLFRNE